MTTATEVPVTSDMSGDELDAEDAWHTIRSHGVKSLLAEAFVRFRYGDGFSHSRALALQLVLATVPLLIALTGLAADIDAEKVSTVIASTVGAVSPGTGSGDAAASALQQGDGGEDVGEVVLVLGLLFALVSMTTAFAQVERGSNRIYGIERDRPALAKYLRAAVMTAVLVVPVGLGFALLVAGGAFGDAMRDVYDWSDTTSRVFAILRWPVGLAVTTAAVGVLLEHAPRRRQPGFSWLALGAGVTVVLMMVASGLLALYVRVGESFGDVYGPLAGVMALLLWSYLTSIALMFGVALAAQLEALRAGVTEPALPDPGPTSEHRRTGDDG
ncbi:YihY/virulence factor BrkB family protein [Solicola sp. PLA-1-18]|uniref:YihY/virulence factor BrkB family protein n=1 Tax=Solicola sp. PLA-1-18 TaxID=3380532 RepID=UPI003B80CDC8